jgi:hypothetical protein
MEEGERRCEERGEEKKGKERDVGRVKKRRGVDCEKKSEKKEKEEQEEEDEEEEELSKDMEKEEERVRRGVCCCLSVF